MDTPETVAFDVGGKLFRVSRNLIEQYSDTMLGKIASETWQRGSSAVVFIDRDGDLFAHVLNYLRYGSIVLPVLISREMFDREMDYYGIITDVNTHTIKQESSFHALELVKNKLEDAELEHDMFLIAVHAYHKFMTGKRLCFFNEDSNIGLCRNPCVHSSNRRLNAKQILKDNLKAYYGIDAWSITFSQAKRTSLFGDRSPGPPFGVNLHLANPAERPNANLIKSGLLKKGEWYCICTTKNPVGSNKCLACETAKPAQLA
mmetsp:Transcript_2289/g.3476  ORF Transcript_2289/g.3476 Transcript_2289/m.3476 type:complete len:260 (+) Transcript_2289:17-796(+)